MYAKNHFLYEERMMEKMGYPDLEDHKKLHSIFVEKMMGHQRKYLKKTDERAVLVSEMDKFLRDWLLDHVTNADKKMVEYKLKHDPR